MRFHGAYVRAYVWSSEGGLSMQPLFIHRRSRQPTTEHTIHCLCLWTELQVVVVVVVAKGPIAPLLYLILETQHVIITIWRNQGLFSKGSKIIQVGRNFCKRHCYLARYKGSSNRFYCCNNSHGNFYASHVWNCKRRTGAYLVWHVRFLSLACARKKTSDWRNHINWLNIIMLMTKYL